MPFITGKIPVLIIFAALSVLPPVTGCGDYKPCETLALRVCTECPHVTEDWQAACLSIERGSLKEKGFKIKGPGHFDKARCHTLLENWDDDTCNQLN